MVKLAEPRGPTSIWLGMSPGIGVGDCAWTAAAESPTRPAIPRAVHRATARGGASMKLSCVECSWVFLRAARDLRPRRLDTALEPCTVSGRRKESFISIAPIEEGDSRDADRPWPISRDLSQGFSGGREIPRLGPLRSLGGRVEGSCSSPTTRASASRSARSSPSWTSRRSKLFKVVEAAEAVEFFEAAEAAEGAEADDGEEALEALAAARSTS